MLLLDSAGPLAGTAATTPAETSLINALRDGDEAAFAELVDRYHGPLKRLARSFGATEAVAEEIVQETWLGALQGLDRFEERSSLKTWLFTILKNQARHRAAREKRSVPFSAVLRGGDGSDDPVVDPDRFQSDERCWPGHWATAAPAVGGAAPAARVDGGARADPQRDRRRCRRVSRSSSPCATSRGSARTRSATCSRSARPTSASCFIAAGRRSVTCSRGISMADEHRHNEVTCVEFVELVTDYMEGALPEERTDLMEEHLVMCDWCKTYLDQIEATVAALPDAAVDEPVADDTREELLTMFREWKAQR